MPCLAGLVSVRAVGRATLVAAALWVAGLVAQAQPAVLSLTGEAVPAGGLADDDGRSAVLAGHAVRLEIDALGDAVDAAGVSRGEAAEITLEVAPGVRVRSQAVWAERRPGGGLTWAGSVEGDAMGFVRLTLEGGVAIGEVVAGGRSFAVRYGSAGRGSRARGQVVYEVVPGTGASCATDADGPLPEVGGRASEVGGAALPGRVEKVRAPTGASPVENDTVFVLMVYTTDVREDLGTGLSAFLQALVDTANDHLVRSDVPGRVALAGAREVPEPAASSTSDMLFSLIDDDDGILDEVNTWRLEESADVVTLLPYGGSGCGIAFLPTIGGNPSLAFNVVKYTCSLVLPNFAHEIGHNLGLHHDPYVGGGGLFGYGNGYVGTVGAFRTVMAYDDACSAAGVLCPAVPYYSTPALSLGGRPLGEEGVSDAARVLRFMMPIVANYVADGQSMAPDAPRLHEVVEEDEWLAIPVPPQSYGAGAVRFSLAFEGMQPSHGSLSMSGAYALTYTPEADFFGADSFAYRVENVLEPDLLWNEGIVRVDVLPVDDPPPIVVIVAPVLRTIDVSPDSGVVSVLWSVQSNVDREPFESLWQLVEVSDAYNVKKEIGKEIGVEAGMDRLDVPMPVLDSVMVAMGIASGETFTFFHRVVAYEGGSRVEGPLKPLRLRRAGGPAGEDQPPDEGTSLPSAPVVEAAYPNPVRGELTLRVGAPAQTLVRVALYDMLGRSVERTRFDMEAGRRSVTLGVGSLPAGVYAYRVEFGGLDATVSGRVVVVR